MSTYENESDTEALRNQRNNWEQTAAQFLESQKFYHGIVIEIGEMFGDAAKISDDGSLQQDVLALKVPELVRNLIQSEIQ